MTPCTKSATPGGYVSPSGTHNDRNVPLHPLLVGLITDYQSRRGPSRNGYLLDSALNQRYLGLPALPPVCAEIPLS